MNLIYKVKHWFKYKLVYLYWNPVCFQFQRLYESVLTKLYKPRIKGTWKEINKTLKTFSTDPRLYINDGLLIRFVEMKDKKYTPYIFVKVQRGILLFRKRNNCFMIPNDCGTYDLSDEHTMFFELLEMPVDMWNINIKEVQKKFRIKGAKKKSHKYY